MNTPIAATVEYDAGGLPVQLRTLLNADAGGVSCPAPNATTLVSAVTGKIPYLQRIELVATVVATVAGDITIDIGLVSYIVKIPAILAVGSRLVVEFPTPIRGTSAGIVLVTVAANGGTWFATANGFFSTK